MGYLLQRDSSHPAPLPYPHPKRAFRAKRHYYIGDLHCTYKVLAVIKQRQDIRMIQLSDGLHFAEEKSVRFPTCFWIKGYLISHHLDSHLLPNTWIFCKVNFTHATTANHLQEVISINSLSFETHVTHLARLLEKYLCIVQADFSPTIV